MVYNKSAVDSYFGTALENIYAWVSNFEVKIIKTGSDFFVEVLQALSNTTEYDMKKYEELIRMIFIGIDQDMYQNWTAIFINNYNYRQEMVSEIDKYDMDDIILNYGGVLCYISGLSMNQLSKVKQKEKKNAISKTFVQK